jgi:hypothetical protein
MFNFSDVKALNWMCRKTLKDILAAAYRNAKQTSAKTRLMALALRFEQLIRSAAVRDYAELAQLGRSLDLLKGIDYVLLPACIERRR